MKRLLETSVGRVVVDFYGDSVAHITLLDDHGWEIKEGEWGDAEVAAGLFYVAGVPRDEAERIEEEVLAEWRSRGGVPRGRWEETSNDLVSVALAALFLLLIVAAIVGLVTIVRTLMGWFA